MSAAGVIDHEAQYGDDDYLCYADHRSDYINAVTILKGCASRFGPNADLVYGHRVVQLKYTQAIEVRFMLFDRALSIFSV